MISATRSIRPAARRRWSGPRRMISIPDWHARLTGTWPTRPGGRMCAPAATPANGWGQQHEGHRPGRWIRYAAASDDAGGVQAIAAGLRQADDLLSAVDADAGGYPRYHGD